MTQRGWLVFLGILILFAIGGWLLFKDKVGTLSIPKDGPAPILNENSPSEDPESIAGFSLPSGFYMNIFADNVPEARDIEIDSKGRILVSQTDEGKISVFTDSDGNGVSDDRRVLAEGLKKPHGLAFKCQEEKCELYVAESNALNRFDYDSESLLLSNKTKLASLNSSPADRHYTRSLLFMPSPNEDTLLVSVGSSCDVCQEKDSQRGRILSYNIKSGKLEEYAKGLRNSVFMALNPITGGVWATEMGRDGLGDNIPPDEINIIQKGKNYGWPICYGKNIHDDKFDKNTYIRNPCMEPFETASHVDLQAHSAPLGLSFIPEDGWSEDYRHHLLVAFHGSWNRSVPTGYKIVRVKLDEKGKYLGVEDFVTGWLKDGVKIGRPADVKVLPGGIVYITDDEAGKIYRVYKK